MNSRRWRPHPTDSHSADPHLLLLQLLKYSGSVGQGHPAGDAETWVSADWQWDWLWEKNLDGKKSEKPADFRGLQLPVVNNIIKCNRVTARRLPQLYIQRRLQEKSLSAHIPDRYHHLLENGSAYSCYKLFLHVLMHTGQGRHFLDIPWSFDISAHWKSTYRMPQNSSNILLDALGAPSQPHIWGLPDMAGSRESGANSKCCTCRCLLHNGNRRIIGIHFPLSLDPCRSPGNCQHGDLACKSPWGTACMTPCLPDLQRIRRGNFDISWSPSH